MFRKLISIRIIVGYWVITLRMLHINQMNVNIKDSKIVGQRSARVVYRHHIFFSAWVSILTMESLIIALLFSVDLLEG